MKIIQGGVTAPASFKASGVSCGIKASEKKDLAVILSEVPATTSAVFTTNKMAAAPVRFSRCNARNGICRAVVINSGNANACTGLKGEEDAFEMIDKTAEALSIHPQDVIVASTGVIGVPLPMDKVEKGIVDAISLLSKEGHTDAAEAIMTTDTYSKEIAVQFEFRGKTVTIGGMAKGSGMIAPNMATMLAFLTTDINICRTCLRASLTEAVNKSFNMITVDGETSTNDMVAVLASGKAGNEKLILGDDDYNVFQKALNYVATELAKMIVKDGEGTTKFIEIDIKGAKTGKDAKKVAMVIANSNLVKTAFFGEDANWGRIISALGHSGTEIDPETVDIYFDDVQIVKNSIALSFDENKVNEILKNDEIRVIVDLNIGDGKAKVWTCDLSYDYVKINASYRT
ncbi:MAG TPA: bifunctional glutamate N-acetyltransferase/amino-acid acetyltransferase ArgJ [Actinobacteria bacterium]|nr:bifunctional glutamate N-acetyltransferase/amino-acid acetyltransferase ArgJ [Actinomycetota bacterium]